jgi:hypothetical protein
MTKALRWILIAALFVLSACASNQLKTASQVREATLTDYGVAIRWNEFDKALGFLDPAALERQPLTDLERERLKQIQVTGYEVKTREVNPDGVILQTVEIRVVNRNTQLERSIIDRQAWQPGADGKSYWLTTGLPDFSAR